MYSDGITVLSLFDGLAGARLALDRAGIPVKTYYASEIDKYAIQVAQRNYPDIIQLGDITRWQEWNIKQPDLIIGGSPCTGFSTSGKKLNFQDPQSKLFFEYMYILKYYRPRWFLFENVNMRKEWVDIITKHIQELYPEVEPVLINSSLVSAQNRLRYYWTNIPNITQPEDKKIVLKDIIEDDNVDQDFKYRNIKYWIKRKQTPSRHGFNIVALCNRGNDNQSSRIFRIDGKIMTATASCTSKLTKDEKVYRKPTPLEYERLQTLPDNYTVGFSKTQRYKMVGNGFTIDVVAHILKGLKKCYT